jgi:8-oxo-dGTP pyrophosphatase MutT (NUDIX family)
LREIMDFYPMTDVWKPNVTVAAVIERDGTFLVVEENTSTGLRINQPAGHLEAGESLTAAVVRETLEESAFDFLPTALLGVYLMPTGNTAQDVTYLRVAFTGELGAFHAQRTLDPDIVRTLWLTRDEIAAQRDRLRSPLVLQCVDDFLAGQRGALELLSYTVLLSHPSPSPASGRGVDLLPSPAERERGRG